MSNSVVKYGTGGENYSERSSAKGAEIGGPSAEARRVAKHLVQRYFVFKSKQGDENICMTHPEGGSAKIYDDGKTGETVCELSAIPKPVKNGLENLFQSETEKFDEKPESLRVIFK